MPLERITEDLSRFIPQELRAEGVPGLSIAIVRNGQLAWSEGFGVARAFTGKPVTSDSLFEVASHSKVVTAYAALQLVARGKLELDVPLDRYLEVPVLPVSGQSEAVTLRRILTHTAGLSNLLAGVYMDTRIWFPPGDRFSYSGHGFEYLRMVMEDVTGEPFESFMERTALADLGMTSSAYAPDEIARRRYASPHLSVVNLLVVFAIAFVVLLLLTVGARWLGKKLLQESARRGERTFSTVLIANTVLSLGGFLLVLRLAGFPPNVTAPLFVTAVLLSAYVAVRLAMRLFRGAGARTFMGLLVTVALLVFVVTRPAVPLPLRSFRMPAAGGLRATASDLARLMVELMEPRHVDPDLIAQMLHPHVRVGEHVSWGLGIGLQHGPQGDSFWHWGLNPGYESLMVAYPEQKIGAVVLTNGGPGGAGLKVARRVVHRAIGGDHYSYWEEVPGAFWPTGVSLASAFGFARD